MEEGARNMVLLLGIALFVNSICQILISSETEKS